MGYDSFVYRATDATPYGNPLPPAYDLARVWILVAPFRQVYRQMMIPTRRWLASRWKLALQAF